MPTEVLRSARRPAHPTLASLHACPFDLVARAELALDGCTALMNPDRDGQPYTYAEFHTDPPIALHAPWDHADSAGCLLEALTLARIMTGTAPDERDAALARCLRASQRDDGLIALPAEPWTHTAPVIEMEWSPRGALLAWTTRYLALEDREALECAQRLVHALHRRAVWEGDTCWFPASFLPESGWTDRQPPIGRMMGVLIGAQVVYPLARFAAATANEEARQLANGLIRFLLERSGAFSEAGQITDQCGRVFRSATLFILGVLKYGVTQGRDDLVKWARAAYECARDEGTEFGFFPHSLTGSDRGQGDIGVTADMIEIALLLGLHVDPRYFAEAERFGRNHLMECQLVDFGWIEDRIDAPFCRELWCAHHPAEGVTTDNVCARALGAFPGWNRLNDAFDAANPRLIQRTTGAGIRALYCLWHNIVNRPEGAAMVNLHFSRDTRWGTVTSQIPQRGGVEVLMKTRGVLAVRVPPDVSQEEVTVMVNHQRPRNETLRGGYAWLEALQNGDVVMVQWPLEERAMIYDVDNTHYTGYWRGDTLLRMNPPGHLTPLYWRPLEMRSARPQGAFGPIKEIDPL